MERSEKDMLLDALERLYEQRTELDAGYTQEMQAARSDFSAIMCALASLPNLPPEAREMLRIVQQRQAATVQPGPSPSSSGSSGGGLLMRPLRRALPKALASCWRSPIFDTPCDVHMYIVRTGISVERRQPLSRH